MRNEEAAARAAATVATVATTPRLGVAVKAEETLTMLSSHEQSNHTFASALPTFTVVHWPTTKDSELSTVAHVGSS